MSDTYDQALQIGEVLNDQYRIDAILGEGGFGITYKAADLQLKRDVVIKEFLPQDFAARGTDTKTVQARTNRSDDYQHGLSRFLDEAQALARFQHPHIAHVNSFLEANGTAYLVMNYAEGMDLSDWLKKRTSSLDEATILKIVTPIVDGLVKVHEAGLLHRDIKPGNIYLRKEGGAMLIDFGAARQALGEHSKSMSAIVSMGYAPPEQYTTRGKQAAFTDLYAIGAVLYKLITGEQPIESVDRSHDMMGGEPDPLIPCREAGKNNVSDWLCELVDQLLKINPKERPQNAVDVLAALKNKCAISMTNEPAQADDNKTRVVTDEQRFKASGTKKTKTQSTETSASINTPSGGALKWVAGLAIVALLGAGGWFAMQGSQSATTSSEQQAKSEAVKALEKGSAILYVNSQPEGANVYFDGHKLGKTPFNADALPAGQHEIKLAHPDYRDEIKHLTLIDNEIVKETIQLKTATGGLSVFSVPEGASIYIDGKNTQKQTPVTLKGIKAGERSITLHKDKYYDVTDTIQIKKDITARVDYALEGGDLVNYKGQWMKPVERDQLVAKVEAKRQEENLRERRQKEDRLKQQAKEKAKERELKRVSETKWKNKTQKSEKEKLSYLIGLNTGSSLRLKGFTIYTKDFKNGLLDSIDKTKRISDADWSKSMVLFTQHAKAKTFHQLSKEEISVISYRLGYNTMNSLSKQRMIIDVDIFNVGYKDGINESKSVLSDEEIKQVKLKLAELMRKKSSDVNQLNISKGKQYIQGYEAQDSTRSFVNGIKYKVLQVGNGDIPSANDTVVAHYEGKLVNGDVFDSSYKRGRPATFPLQNVIKGWRYVVTKMKVGSKWEVVIPPALAYGEKGAGSVIPAGATLVFVIELIDIK